MKLIKLNPNHFIVVDDSDIKENDFVFVNGNIGRVISVEEETLLVENTPFEIKDGAQEFWIHECNKITHSTQPLDGVKLISLSEVKELIGEVDVEKLAELNGYPESSQFYDYKEGFIDGYEQAVEDNKDKKYTEEDINKALSWGYHAAKDEAKGIGSSGYGTRFFESIQTKPKTEWDVEFVDRILRLI